MSYVLNGLVPLGLVLLVCGAQGFFLPNVTHLEKLLSKYRQDEPHSRARRAIPRSDQEEILMLHNKLRGQVHPPASNMEHMVSLHTPGPGPGLPLLCPQSLLWSRLGGGGVPGGRGSPALFLMPHQTAPVSRGRLPELSPRAALRLLEGGVGGPRGWAPTS